MASFWCLIVNFEHISHLALVFLLEILNKYLRARLADQILMPIMLTWQRNTLILLIKYHKEVMFL